MADGARLLIGLLAGVLLISSLPLSNAEDNATNDLEIILNLNLKEVYLQGESLVINPSLINHGEDIQISNNPSCEFYFQILDDYQNLFYDSSHTCRNQNQDLVINHLETIDLGTMTWDFLNWEGEFIPTGNYELKVFHSSAEISSSYSIHFYDNLEIDPSMIYALDTYEIFSNNVSTGDQVLLVTISNPTDSEIILPSNYCKVIVEIEEEISRLDVCSEDLESLKPYEYSFLGSKLIRSPDLIAGLNEIKVYPPGKKTISVIELENSNLENTNISDQHSLTASLSLEEKISSFNHKLSILINFDDLENDASILESECLFNIYIVNDQSADVYTRENIECSEKISSIENNRFSALQFELDRWGINDKNNCQLESGTYTIIVNSQATGLTMTEQYHHVNKNSNSECFNPGNKRNYQTSSVIVDQKIISTITVSLNNEIKRMDSECLGSIDYSFFVAGESISETNYFCDYKPGNYFKTEEQNDILIVLKESYETTNLPSNQPVEITVSYRLTWDITNFKQERIVIEHNQIVTDSDGFFEIDGTWDIITHDDTNCWLLSSPNSAYIISNEGNHKNFNPKQNWQGTYLASNTDSNECSMFELPIINVHEIFDEYEIDSVIEEELAKEEQEVVITITEISVIAVTSTSILAGLILFVSNTETLRVPATSAGLWLLGLVGKTHETSDGKFQRGRLIGYLTANPGCHFRGLMAALSMSNGQITHHLRILENQDLVWRVNDGRFVRYYPLNNSLYPGMNPENLPVPLLSPDPKSLQGKILTLLDNEHQFGQFPTQSELAMKLEKSQQLISHHLRTLQKYGLVERRKMGVKNRYKLTKEAIFLLETDLEFTKIKN